MAERRDYKVYTLNAKEIISMSGKRDGCFDLTSEYDRNKIVQSEELYTSCALFDQILSAANKKDPQVVTTKLVHLYFSGGLKGIKRETGKLLKEGFKLRFPGQSEYTSFRPFDKSASMSRNNKISFISEDVYETVERNLNLGLELRLLKHNPSKYYAYRGLYMTEGIRINPAKLELDEKTVIVIKTGRLDIWAENISVSNQPNDRNKIVVSPDKKETKEKYSTKPFDGEGLIDPAYASVINRQTSHKIGREATSFQIRMPFTKGMLHTVDFRKFLTDQFPDEDIENLTITDVFGIKRKIADARIILTDSMFKCGNWIGKYFTDPAKDEEPEEIHVQADPMAYYFSRMKRFGHAMYLVGSDADFRTDSTVRMNYQFLNTLDMDRPTFRKLVERHIEDTRKITADPYHGREALLGTGEMEEEKIANLGERELRGMETWEYALRSNIAFIDDPLVSQRLKQAQISQTGDIRKGRLVVPGTMKYLSDDLLMLLISIAELCDFRDGETTKNRIEYLRSYRTLYPDRFFIAGSGDSKLDEDKYYAVLRSPHLSRNEQCSLRPAYLSIYKKYFRHLRGVMMVSIKSSTPAALGGADFDGDIVKIIEDEDINNAVFKGSYAKATVTVATEEGEIERTVHQRRLPVVNIVSPKDKDPILLGDRVSEDDLNASFSSNVGRISNIAFVLGKHEYAQDPDGSVPEGTTALCTIATGLEIDSVKTGVKPDYSELEKMCRVDKDSFLNIDKKFKEIAEDSRRKDKPVQSKLDADKGEYKAYFRYNNKRKKEETLFTAEEEQAFNVDMLPYYYAKELTDWKTAGRKVKNQADAFAMPAYRFRFEAKSEDWREMALANPNIEVLRSYIVAFREIHRRAGRLSEWREKTRGESLRGSVETLLYTKYDRANDRLYKTGAGLRDAIDTAYEELYDLLQTSEDAGEKVKRMKESNWQYVQTEEEKEEILNVLFGEEQLSPVARELLCDTYDNGYQYLNFILRDVEMFRKGEEEEAAENLDGELMSDEQYEELFRKNASKDEISKDLFRLMERYYRNSPDRRDVWSEQVCSLCRDMVEDLFQGDMASAVKCTVALDEDVDKNHRFLWGVFTPEDISKVIYIEKEGKTDAE